MVFEVGQPVAKEVIEFVQMHSKSPSKIGFNHSSIIMEKRG
jgi:hypothetical protein